MIYKKIVNNIPSLSSLLLAGMVFGGCNKDEVAGEATPGATTTSPVDASGHTGVVTGIPNVDLTSQEIASLAKIAMEIMESMNLGYLKSAPASLDLTKFFELKKGKAEKVQLDQWVKDLAAWENCPNEWKTAFTSLADLKFVTGTGVVRGKGLHNKTASAEALSELVQDMTILHKVYSEIAIAASDVSKKINVGKLQEEVNTVANRIAGNKVFDLKNKFYNKEKFTPPSSDSLLVKCLNKFVDSNKGDEGKRTVWVSNAEGARFVDIDDTCTVNSTKANMPAVAQVTVANQASAQDLQLDQIFFSLFMGREAKTKGLAQSATSLDFLTIEKVKDNDQYTLTADQEIFERLYNAAMASDGFAQALTAHITANAQLKGAYIIPARADVVGLVQAISKLGADNEKETLVNAWAGIEGSLKTALGDTGVALAAIKAYVDSDSFMQQLCAKIANSFDPESSNKITGLSMTTGFDPTSEGSAKTFRDAIVDQLIAKELDKLIVKPNLTNEGADYQHTPVTEFIRNKIKDLGNIFSTKRGATYTTYEHISTDSDGYFNIDKLVKLPESACKVFSFILGSDLRDILFKEDVVVNLESIKVLHPTIPDDAKRKALVEKIQNAKNEYKTQKAQKAAPAA